MQRARPSLRSVAPVGCRRCDPALLLPSCASPRNPVYQRPSRICVTPIRRRRRQRIVVRRLHGLGPRARSLVNRSLVLHSYLGLRVDSSPRTHTIPHRGAGRCGTGTRTRTVDHCPRGSVGAQRIDGGRPGSRDAITHTITRQAPSISNPRSGLARRQLPFDALDVRFSAFSLEHRLT